MPRSAAHLWPFSRALVATLDLAGIDPGLMGQIDLDAEIGDRLGALERYWDAERHPPAYSSDLRGSWRGGDRYYDDNAWVGLAWVQLERMHGGVGYLARAEELFRFATAGWAWEETPNPGGVYWVEQGRGLGAKNHDRNTVSTAPNAQLGLHIAELKADPAATPATDPTATQEGRSNQTREVGPTEMYEWVLGTLDESLGSDDAGTGLFWDKVCGDRTVDRTIWSYNQGSMVGVNVLLGRRSAAGGGAEYLRRAELIAGKALLRFAGAYERQPAAFNAIFFRNLLLLHTATSDESLQQEMIEAIQGYVDKAWSEARDNRDRFHLANGGVTLLNQSAMVQLLALLAWDPGDYGWLA